MSAHSYLRIGNLLRVVAREDYDPDVAGLFNEADWVQSTDTGEDGFYAYVTNLGEIRERLQVQGLKSKRALSELEMAISLWKREFASDDSLFDLSVTEYD